MDIGWTLRRYAHLGRRLSGSIAIRGWKATLRRAMRSRADGTDDIAVSSEPVPAKAPAPGHAARRILVIERMTPDPARDSGSMRLCQIFALLNADGWTIDFLADDDDASASDVARLASIGVNVRRGNPARWLAAEGDRFDAVMLCRLPVADQYAGLVRRHAPRARLLFDTVDLHFVREQRAADLTGNARLARQAARSRRHELDIVQRSDVTLVVSDEERDILAREAPTSQVAVISNIHEVAGLGAPYNHRSGLLFVGGFGHPPNEDAVRWFVEHVHPLLLARDPAMVFHVVGDIDDDARRSLERPGIQVHGRVADLEPLLASARLSVAPLRFGAGVKGKVNQAMSHGLPVVVTSIAAEGMHLEDGVNALIVDEPAATAEAIWRVYHDEALWNRLSAGGMQNVQRHFSIGRARDALRHALGDASP